ncbi:hypothetical protein BDV98DRAFT_586885 [Pterulicium gracile]|uniref:Uncharacterized protein n=1 Tax=Pterulicium gracile TaxID=1884261 RepID=A0A5C3Q3C7_9AGAR|nr:hypothetical protein BDV98DRAFT_586885 [Pterula gracilis]
MDNIMAQYVQLICHLADVLNSRAHLPKEDVDGGKDISRTISTHSFLSHQFRIVRLGGYDILEESISLHSDLQKAVKYLQSFERSGVDLDVCWSGYDDEELVGLVGQTVMFSFLWDAPLVDPDGGLVDDILFELEDD